MCDCKTADETGTRNGSMCAWHRDKYLAALTDERQRVVEACAKAGCVSCAKGYAFDPVYPERHRVPFGPGKAWTYERCRAIEIRALAEPTP